MSRIFISHSHHDNARAVEVRAWLAANGWDDVFLDIDAADGLAPGERWQNALKAAADRCEAVLFLISPNWLKSSWCLSEFLLAKQLGKRMFPILIDGASMAALPTEISSDHQAVDLIGDPLGWERLKEGLRRAGLDANSFPFPKGRRPYPGFEPLTEEDAAIFFGREAQVLRGLDRLRLMRDAGAERMMVVLGASGAGKSSFMRAGFWPRLRRDDRNFLPLPTIRPERAVLSGKSGLFAALEKTLADQRLASRPELAAVPRSRAALGSLLEKDSELPGLLAAIRQAATQSFRDSPPPALVLLIDQGEELLNEEGRAESERFMQILGQALDREKGFLVVLAIRSDAFPQFQAKPALAAIAREPFDLAPMPEGSLRLVIEGPASFASPPLKLEPALVDTLLADSTGQDALPLLAFTLDWLAREYGAEGSLKLADYASVGGIRGVVTVAVEEALAEGRKRGSTPADPAVLHSLLKQAFIPHLARVNDAGEFARRIAYADEIPLLARPLINLLVEARLLTRDRDNRGETIEVAHEALLREWPLLRGFLEADREFLISKRQIADDLKSWEEAPPDKKSDALISGLRLTRAQHYLAERPAQDLTDRERAFIGESVRSAETSRRRRNFLTAGAIVLLAAFSAVAAMQWVSARREAEMARINAEAARVSKEEAQNSADSFRKARDQADENAKRAEINEARAYRAQARAQIQESISLADQSLRQTANGDVQGAMRTALAALPRDPANLDRPYVPRADYALAKAFLANRPQAAIKPSADWVNDVVYNRDGTQFSLGTRDGFFKSYDAKTHHELTSSNERRQAVMSIAASADGSRLAVAYQNPPSLAVRDGASGKMVRMLRLSALPNRILLTRDGSTAVVLSQQWEPRPAIIDLNNESGNVRFVESHPKLGGGLFVAPRAAALSPDERLLVFVRDGAVYAWELSTGSLVATSADAKPGVRHLDLASAKENESIDGAAFVGDSGDAVLVGNQHVYVVDLRTATVKSSHAFSKTSEYVTSRGPLLPPNGDSITFPINKRTLATYSLSDWNLVAKRELPADMTEIAISPDGKLIAAACADFSVRAWPIRSSEPIGVFLGHNERVRGITFSPDGRGMITYGDTIARVWDLRASGVVLDVQLPDLRIRSINLQSMVANVEPSSEAKADGAAEDAGINLWNVPDRKPVGSEAVMAFIRNGALLGSFSPSGKWVAIKREYSGDDLDARRQDSKILTDLAREVAADAAPIELRDGGAHAIAIVDTQSGKATRLLVTGSEARSYDVKFVGDDGNTLGLSAEDYNGDNSKSFAEIWDAKSGRKLLSVTQDGYDARLLYVPESSCAVFTTRPRWSDYVSSAWSLSSGERIAGFDRPIAPYDDESAATRLLAGRDRVLLGDGDNRPSLIQCSTGKEIGAIGGAAVGASRLLMSPDRHRMLVETIGAPRTLWDLDNAKKLAAIPDGEFDGSVVQFSDDSRRIVTREWRNKKETIQVFDGESGNLIKSFAESDISTGVYVGLGGKVIAVERTARDLEILQVDRDVPPIRISLQNNLRRWSFSVSDDRLVTVDETGQLGIWDTRTGARTYELAGLDRVDPLGGTSFKGKHIPLLMAAGGAAVLNVSEGKIIWQQSHPGQRIVGLQLAPDEKSIVVTEADGIGLFALDPAEKIASIPIGAGEEAYFAYDESGERTELFVRVAGGGVGTVRLVDVPRRMVIGQLDAVAMTAMAPRADKFASVDQRKLLLRDVRSGALEREVEFDNPISQIDWDLAGRTLVVMTNDLKIWSLDAAEGKPKLVASLRIKPLWLRYAADPTKLLVYEKSSRATLRDTGSGKLLTSFAVEWSRRSSLNRWTEKLDSSGAFVAIRSPDNYLRVYRASDGSRLTELNWDDNKIADVAFSADAKRLLLVTEKGMFSNWDIAAGKPLPSPSLPREYSAYSTVTLKSTADPSLVLAIDRKGYVDLYSLNTNSVRTFYAGEPEENVNAALSPDGAILATIGSGDMLRIWHVGAREVLAQIPLRNNYSKTSLQFSADGRILVVDGRDETRLIRVPLLGDALLTAVKAEIGSEAQTSSSGTPLTPYRFGVQMRDVSPEIAKIHELPAARGAEVIEVFADSPAQAAGLRVGDIILSVNGKPVGNATESSAAIKDTHLDLGLEIVRGTEKIAPRAALPD